MLNEEVIERIKGRSVLVVGDVTLDKFIIGRVSRISPEAPVPIVDVESEFYSLGAAANVINNLRAMEAKVWIATVVGNDPEGDYIIREIRKTSTNTDGIFKDDKKITAVVSRVRTADHQLLRMDRAKDEKIDIKTALQVANYAESLIGDLDIIVVSDYGRGVITSELMEKLVKIAKKHDKKIVVNPKREHFLFYSDVDVIRTNVKEAGYVTGVSATDEAGLYIAGEKILNSLHCKAVLITWIESGFYLFEQGGRIKFIPPVIRHPVDVTGVGDTITSVLALGLAAGASLEDSAKLANYAGAVVANKIGLAVPTPEEIRVALTKGIPD